MTNSAQDNRSWAWESLADSPSPRLCTESAKEYSSVIPISIGTHLVYLSSNGRRALTPKEAKRYEQVVKHEHHCIRVGIPSLPTGAQKRRAQTMKMHMGWSRWCSQTPPTPSRRLSTAAITSFAPIPSFRASIDYRNPPNYGTLMNPKYPDLFFACSHLATFSSSINNRSVCTWYGDCYFLVKIGDLSWSSESGRGNTEDET